MVPATAEVNVANGMRISCVSSEMAHEMRQLLLDIARVQIGENGLHLADIVGPCLTGTGDRSGHYIAGLALARGQQNDRKSSGNTVNVFTPLGEHTVSVVVDTLASSCLAWRCDSGNSAVTLTLTRLRPLSTSMRVL